ncbi:putative ankyrin repeat domain-containing protein SOWAHC-like [Scophthalmus maximus]|uniref:Putative ankyrin repeat domain-containing protein SOWAHC-like n=1 Tax=Scophthalmus maximus TaxID=52904 RepID=A0A2U9BXL3_SCOMX|nr:putative ankyrin repeat domain-containing protein SOWAHC-like [Scophthalmus maximus]
MMLRSGADVNVKSGYTALHLASIHGHRHVVHALVNTYNAKTSVRDYHGKTAPHYWSGGSDVFAREDSQSGARLSRGRRTQRYVLPSLLLTRSRSHGQLHLEFVTAPQSTSHDVLNLHV